MIIRVALTDPYCKITFFGVFEVSYYANSDGNNYIVWEFKLDRFFFYSIATDFNLILK